MIYDIYKDALQEYQFEKKTFLYSRLLRFLNFKKELFDKFQLNNKFVIYLNWFDVFDVENWELSWDICDYLEKNCFKKKCLLIIPKNKKFDYLWNKFIVQKYKNIFLLWWTKEKKIDELDETDIYFLWW